MHIRRFLLVFLFALLGVVNVSGVRSADSPPRTVRFSDVLGNEVHIVSPVRRMVVINGDAVEILCALGAEESIVGISSHTAETAADLYGLEGKTVVGSAMSPSMEKIIECQPDLVIAYEKWMTQEAFEDKLAPLGISVARMHCYRIDRLDREIRLLGALVGKEHAAESYIQYLHHILTEVATRLKGLQSKIRIYNESYAPYKTVSDGSGADQFLDLAGVENIAAGQPVPSPEISAEWVVEKNPDVIVKVASSVYVKNGYGIKNVQAVEDFRNELMSRPAWDRIAAVQNGRVHILSSELWMGPRAPLGILYVAKWAYPELFRDIDPEEVHRRWLMKWHGKALKGIYVYP